MERSEKKENDMIRFVRCKRMRDARRRRSNLLKTVFEPMYTSVFAPCTRTLVYTIFASSCNTFCSVFIVFFPHLFIAIYIIFRLCYFLDFQYFGSAELSIFLFSTHDTIIIIFLCACFSLWLSELVYGDNRALNRVCLHVDLFSYFNIYWVINSIFFPFGLFRFAIMSQSNINAFVRNLLRRMASQNEFERFIHKEANDWTQ